MADNSITVDELAIKVVAEAATAASSIDLLTASLSKLTMALAPALASLGRLGPALNRANAGSLRAAAKMNSAGAVAGMGAKIAPAALGGAASGAAATVATTAAIAPIAQVAQVSKLGQVLGVVKTKVASVAQGFSSMGATVLGKVKSSIASVTQSIGTMGRTGSTAVKTLGGSFIQLRSAIFFAFFALTALAAIFKVTVGGAVDYIESLNLFQVAMRNNTAEANKFVSAMTAAFGLDPKRIMEYQSTFFQIAESSGIANKNAYALSEILTRLTFDFASLRNMKLEDVFIKMQGVLTGQARAMRALGVDVSLTHIKELALSMGIKKNVAEMTNAEKTLLRLVAAYKGSAVAQGDMARTLLQPANLLRVLGDQFSITARAIGSLFIPMLTAVIPYVIWFVRAIGQAFTALAAFFGVDMSQMVFTIPDVPAASMASSMDKAAKGAGKAAAATKKMRDNMLGIDELNIVSPDTASGSGGGGGGGGGGGAGGDISDTIAAIQAEMAKMLTQPFTDLMDKIGKSVGEAFKPIQPFIDAIGRLWNALLPFMANVWKGFTDFWNNVLIPLGLWTLNTVGVFVLDQLTQILDWFNQNPTVAQVIGGVIAALMAFKMLTGILNIIKMFGTLFNTVFGIKALAAIAGGGWIALGFAAIVAIGVVLVKNWAAISAWAVRLWASIKPVRDLFVSMAAQLNTAMRPALAALMSLWKQLAPIFQGVGEIIVNVVVAALGALVVVLSMIAGFLPGLIQMFAGMATVVVSAFNLIASVAVGDAKGIATALEGVKQGVRDTALGAASAATGLVTGAAKGFTAVSGSIDAFNNSARTANTTGQTVTTTWGRISSAATKVSSAIDSATGAYVRQTLVMSDGRTAREDALRNLIDIKSKQDALTQAITTYGKGSAQADMAQMELNDAQKLGAASAQYLSDKQINAAVKAGTLTKAMGDAAKAARTAAQDMNKAFNFSAEGGINELHKLYDKWYKLGKLSAVVGSIQHNVLANKYAGNQVNRISGYAEFASGGMPTSGSLFRAGEAGKAELVGQYGGKTTVMPLENSGFVEAMASAVYGAVASAMGSGDSGGTGDVYLNGTVVGKVLRAEDKRMGIAGGLVRVSV